MIDTHHKLTTRIYNHAQEDVDRQTRKQGRMIRSSLSTLHLLGQVILDEAIQDGALRRELFSKVDKEKLTSQMAAVETGLTGKYSHVFNLVVERFPNIRQFAPTIFAHLEFRLEEGPQSTVVEAVTLLRQMNEGNKRKLVDDAPLGFIPKNLRSLVEKNGEVNKRAWECAMLGRRFAPRIRALKKQRIYRIEKAKEYGALAPLVDRCTWIGFMNNGTGWVSFMHHWRTAM